MTARRLDDDIVRQLESLAKGEPLPASMMTIDHADVEALPRAEPGAMPAPPHLNDWIEIDFASAALPGRVVWTNGAECGVAFDRKMDGYALMTRMAAGVRADAPEWRGPSALKPAKLDPDDGFRPGLRVKVVLEGGDERSAVVNWARDRFAGLVLDD